MSAYALVSGALFKKPEQKVSRNGKSFVTALLKSKVDDSKFDFWRVTVFSETAQETLMRLNEGDTLSAQGSLKAELYAPEGKEARISLNIIADSIQPLRAAKKERSDKPAQYSNSHNKGAAISISDYRI